MNSFIKVFENTAALHAGETAVVDLGGRRRTSYADLNDLRLRVAAKISGYGFDKGSCILINMGRSRDYVAAYLGIQTAGCAAVPLTPEYPEKRIEYIRSDCGSMLTITEEFFDDIDSYAAEDMPLIEEDIPAHITYTSGSTGNPKGVVHTVGSIYRVACRDCDLYDIGERVVYAAASTFTFFICVYDILRPLSIGGEVHIVSDSVRKDANKLSRYYTDHKITMGFISPQLMKNFSCSSPCLKRVLVGGELASNIYSDDYEIINVYGSSETGLVSCFRIDRPYENTPVGKPFPDCTFDILPDEDGNGAGELLVTGIFAREYLNLPENSSETFDILPDGTVRYHTGDRVRLLDDGNYLYLNRKDWMVKVNGQRVEALEVETVMRSIEGVENSAVKSFADSDGQNYLCAYYISDSLSESEVRTALSARLPAYMIPRFLIPRDSLPLTLSGKLDRTKLAPPSLDDYKAEYAAPSNEREKAVCDAFEEVLGCGKTGINDDFFALGGDSIKALKLTACLERRGIPGISSSDVLALRTAKGIASVSGKNEEDKSVFEKASPATLPLTLSQRGVYLECIEDPSSTKYNIPFCLPLPQGTDTDRFINSVLETVSRHPALFATVRSEGDSLLMVPGGADVKVGRIRAESLEKAGKEFVRPFDLEKGPLCRFAVAEAPEGQAFLLDVHHLVFDGTSVRILLRQIADAYEGKAAGDEKLTLFDVAEREKTLLSSDEYKQAQKFFEEKFSGCEYDTYIAPDVQEKYTDEKAGTVQYRAPSALSADVVEDFARKTGITESTLFTAAFAYTLSLLSGSRDSFFTTVSSGRHSDALSDTVGMFVKTLPLHVPVKYESTVRDFLRDVQSSFYETLSHDCISFAELAGKYGVNSDINFVYQSDLLSEIKIGESPVMPEELPLSDCLGKILSMLIKTSSGYEMRTHYLTSLYTEGFIEALSETLFTVASQMMKCEKLSQIDAVSESQKEFMDRINGTETPYDESETLSSLLEGVIKKYPDREAVSFEGRSVSFAEMDGVTSKIASYISSLGIGKDDFVALIAPRNGESFLACWGILRAGAAIQFLDPSYPADRLSYMISDSGAKLLIADRSLENLVGDYGGKRLRLDETDSLPDAESFRCETSRNGAAALIYTSGTTGKPKGCVLEVRNLVAFFHSHKDVMELDENSRVASFASFGFDAGIMDIVTTPLSGAALYIIPDEKRLDLEAVERFYCDNGITQGFMTTQVGRMFAQQTKCDTLKVFTFGGEKLVPFAPPERFRLVNGYGPCETMAYICHFDVRNPGTVQPIGKPSMNTKLYVTDALGRRLPVGGCGELCIAGAQVSRGYLNLEEKTAEVFVANPFCSSSGYGRMYRTGDIVRLLPDGNLEYVGRQDRQIKIRGFRVELTEIEEVIRRFDGIKDATVAAFDLPGGGKYLAAYVVSSGDIDAEALKDFIRSEKPPYMVPPVVMKIDAIPHTQNHKVNVRALPAPSYSAEITPDQLPQNDIQKKIYDIAKDILGHESFGISTDLFEAGLTSITALKFNSELGKAFERGVRIAEIKKNPTVRALAALLSEDEGETYGILDFYPLMKNQTGVFLDSNMDSSNVRYNIPVLFSLSENIDPDALAAAVKSAVDAHPYMKATLASGEGGEITVLRNDFLEPKIEIIECDALPDPGELVRPFELLGSELYRACIYKTHAGNYLFMDMHHLISDGTSVDILLSDINSAYAGKEVEKEKYTAFEASLDEKKRLESPSFAEGEKYYETLLSGCSTESLPAKCPEDASSPKCLRRTYTFTGSDSINEYCERNSLSKNAFFNAAFSYTLSEFLHADDITYCTVYNGRNDSRLDRCCSMLVKTLPVRVYIDTKSRVADFVRAMQNQLIETMSNDIVPFSDLCSRYSIKPDIFFNYQGDSFVFDEIGGEKAGMISIGLEDAKAPLTLELFCRNGVYSVEICCRKDYYCEDFVSSLAHSLITVAEGFAAEENLSGVGLMSESEMKFFKKMNDTAAPFEKVPAQTFIERNASDYPDRTAVISRTGSLTFAQLNEKANALANALIASGAEKGSVVGMILDRTELVPVAELGILKAGCAFLPMLPTYPDERLSFCLLDADCRFVIAEKATIDERKDLFSKDRPYTALSIEETADSGSASCPDVEITPDMLAYCIYTSGSTGKPKGVMIEHHSETNYIQNSCVRALEKDGSTVLCMSSISFDMSLTEIFSSLSLGKTIYIASEEEIHNLDMLLEAFEKHGIDIMMMTPSFAWNLVSLPEFEGALSNLKGILLAAEAFRPALFDKLRSLNPDMVIMNGYGPTETTQGCSFKEVTDGRNITIGGPLENSAFYVTDSCGNLLPRYAVGELMICGEGVSRGYVKLPEKNAASYTEIAGLRAYHSGDLVRINRDGEAEFGGRADNLVKLRGFRVDLDEVEAVMQQFDGVIQSKVVVRNNGAEDYLAGFFTATKQIDTDALASFMKGKLTYYMVPSAMMQLEKMPMTPNGKLDKKALPEISPAKKKARERRAPKKSLEQKILELFCSVLSIDECYTDDNFFELGGTSLSASKAVMQLKSEGYKIEYQDIFDHQSAEELAEYLESLEVRKAVQGPSEAGNPLVSEDEGIKELLKHNSLEFADQVKRESLGTVLLTGCCGFLGAHVLKSLIEIEDGPIICLMRKGSYDDLETRLKTTLVYYFEDDYDELFSSRISLIEGDITDDGLNALFEGVTFDTLINCAASVKHYANDNSIEFVNVHGVENLIALTREKNAKMIQISTTSVPGAHSAETYKANLTMKENELFVIDDMNNQYGQSKYHAELKMLDAIKGGMRGKIIRVGNLMGRHSDGEFQANSRTNAFLNALRGFVNIGKCPISHCTDPMKFSPIDCTAQAVVLLAGTNDMFTAFHADSRQTFDEMKVMDTLGRCGITVTPVPDDEYYSDFYRLMGDPKMNEKISALLTNDRPDMHMVETDNRFTANVLYRIGFSWPFIDDAYLERVIRSLDALDFFFME